MSYFLVLFAAFSCALNLSAMNHWYSLHIGGEEYQIAGQNLYKSALLKSIAISPSTNIRMDHLGNMHFRVEAVPGNFAPMYRFLVDGVIVAKTKRELEQLKENASFYQVGELDDRITQLLADKDRVLVRRLKIILTGPDWEEWDEQYDNRLDLHYFRTAKEKKCTNTTMFKKLGSLGDSNLLVAEIAKEKIYLHESQEPHRWQTYVKYFEAGPNKYGTWDTEFVDVINKKLDEIFKDPTQIRLISIEPLGMSNSNAVRFLMKYKKAE